MLAPGCTSVYAQYTIEVANREKVEQALKAQGIPTAVHYPVPLHMQPVFAGAHAEGGRVAQRLYETGICLPSSSSLPDEDQRRVIEAVRNVVSATAGRIR